MKATLLAVGCIPSLGTASRLGITFTVAKPSDDLLTAHRASLDITDEWKMILDFQYRAIVVIAIVCAPIFRLITIADPLVRLPVYNVTSVRDKR